MAGGHRTGGARGTRRTRGRAGACRCTGGHFARLLDHRFEFFRGDIFWDDVAEVFDFAGRDFDDRKCAEVLVLSARIDVVFVAGDQAAELEAALFVERAIAKKVGP